MYDMCFDGFDGVMLVFDSSLLRHWSGLVCPPFYPALSSFPCVRLIFLQINTRQMHGLEDSDSSLELTGNFCDPFQPMSARAVDGGASGATASDGDGGGSRTSQPTPAPGAGNGKEAGGDGNDKDQDR